jgi:hypothetical protein
MKTMWPAGSGGRFLIAIVYVVVAIAGVWLMYAPTLGYGFDYDDYHFIRPYPVDEVRAAFAGPWDPSGIEVPFYRPLTIAFFAARFHVFGLNSEAYHALSLAMFATAVLLFGLFVRATLSSAGAGIAGMAVLLVHPAMPYAAVAWVTNQMHLLAMLIVLGALLWWTHVRTRGARWWMPLIAFEAAALLVKEDGVMLIPAIVAVHLLYRFLVEPRLQWPPFTFLLVACATGAALLAFRHAALLGLHGYTPPDAATAWQNFRRGWESVYRLMPARRPWQQLASWLATTVPLAACIGWRRLPHRCRFGIAAGLTLGVLFNLPFVIIVKVQQLHLVAMSAALLLTSAGVGLATMINARMLRIGVSAALACGVLVLAAVTRNIMRDFEPFGPIILSTDNLVTGWAAVPPELREYLVQKKQPGAALHLPANPALALDSVVFGARAWESGPDGRRFRWMEGDEIEIYVNTSAARVTVPLRHAIDLFREPARARLELDGHIVDDISLESGEWRASTIAFGGAHASPLRKMHRIVLRIERTWSAAPFDPRAANTPRLGLQIGELQIR